MNRFVSILAVACCLAACGKEEKETRVETRSVTGITGTEAVCWGKIASQGSGEIKEYGIELLVEGRKIPHTVNKNDSFGTQLTGLGEGRSYNYRAYAINNGGQTVYGGVRTFTTFIPAEFSVWFVNITEQSADIEFTNTGQLQEWGFYYSANAETTASDARVEARGQSAVPLTGLQPYTEYCILPYATDKNGVKCLAPLYRFYSGYASPQLTVPTVSEITVSGAAVAFSVTSTGGGTALSACELHYSADGQNWTKQAVTYVEGTVTSTITGLAPATTYQLRAYARNNGGKENTGETAEFTTAGAKPTLAKPTVTAQKSYKVSMSGGKVTDENLLPVTEYGFCWSTAPGAVAEGSNFAKVNAGSKDAFEYTNYTLFADTKYYIRAYAKNAAGIGYSEEVTVDVPAVVYGEVADGHAASRKYKTVVIGSQTWMAENLVFAPLDEDLELFNQTMISSFKENMCPTGWHVPTQAEYNELIAETGGNSIAPKLLRVPNEPFPSATNSTGFSAVIQAGIGNSDFWTSTLWYNEAMGGRPDGYYIVYFYPNGTNIVTTLHNDIRDNMPVRCVKNNQ